MIWGGSWLAALLPSQSGWLEERYYASRDFASSSYHTCPVQHHESHSWCQPEGVRVIGGGYIILNPLFKPSAVFFSKSRDRGLVNVNLRAPEVEVKPVAKVIRNQPVCIWKRITDWNLIKYRFFAKLLLCLSIQLLNNFNTTHDNTVNRSYKAMWTHEYACIKSIDSDLACLALSAVEKLSLGTD